MIRCTWVATFLLAGLIFLGMTAMSVKADSNLSWKIGVDAGPYAINSSDGPTRSRSFVGFDAQLNAEISALTIHLRGQPQFFGFEDSERSLRLDGRASYQFRRARWILQSEFDIERDWFDLNQAEITYQTRQFSGSIHRFLNKKMLATLHLTFIQARTDNIEERSQQGWIVRGLTRRMLSRYHQSSAGIYAEFLHDEHDPAHPDSVGVTREGWRFGPEVHYRYQRRTVVRFDYRLLFDRTSTRSRAMVEHWLRLVLGAVIHPDWTAHALFDFYLRDMKSDEARSLGYLLAHENRAFIKLSHEWRPDVSYYLKAGFEQQQPGGVETHIEGWRILVGFELGS